VQETNTITVPEYFNHKAIGMRVFGATLLVAFLPVMLACMLLVRLSSRGPAIYRQTRVGKDDQLFKLYKIRTMYANCENVSGPVLCQPGDSRVTPVGRILRFLHLDELPQLINVARGEMCLVGPRPERPEIIMRHKLKENVPSFADRTKVLPGVTGLAQINLPADISIDCVKPKVQLDLEYIETATAGLDLRILACTAFRMIGVRHGRAARLFGVVRPNPPRLDNNSFSRGHDIPQDSSLYRGESCPNQVAFAGVVEGSDNLEESSLVWRSFEAIDDRETSNKPQRQSPRPR
jgi:lipopolysaccharide/colanic/teichoic acid biosynthesis glycosyltransferase